MQCEDECAASSLPVCQQNLFIRAAATRCRPSYCRLVAPSAVYQTRIGSISMQSAYADVFRRGTARQGGGGERRRRRCSALRTTSSGNTTTIVNLADHHVTHTLNEASLDIHTYSVFCSTSHHPSHWIAGWLGDRPTARRAGGPVGQSASQPLDPLLHHRRVSASAAGT